MIITRVILHLVQSDQSWPYCIVSRRGNSDNRFSYDGMIFSLEKNIAQVGKGLENCFICFELKGSSKFLNDHFL